MFYEEKHEHGRSPFIRDKYVLQNFHREINCSAYIFQQRKHKYSPYLQIVRSKVGQKRRHNNSRIIPDNNKESVRKYRIFVFSINILKCKIC